ncbi:hypothetical protein B9W68_00295 [Streptomyces sp. CS227]|nr:hypothetical protein B9W68_00295 [Streptomyces sp. CS227]
MPHAPMLPSTPPEQRLGLRPAAVEPRAMRAGGTGARRNARRAAEAGRRPGASRRRRGTPGARR